MPSHKAITSSSLILLSILSQIGSTKAQIRGEGLRCSDELELKLNCMGECEIPPASTSIIDLNYQVAIKSKTAQTWQLTQAMVQAGSLTKPIEVLPLPLVRDIDNGEPLFLSYSIRSDELVGETPLLQAIVSAATEGGGRCQLDTNTIEVIPLSASIENGQDTPITGRTGSESMSAAGSQPASSFAETFTREISMFMNYEIGGSGDRQPTSDEYQTVVRVTEAWMIEEVATLFASPNSRGLQDVSMAIETAEYKQTEKYSHQIRFVVGITWGANALGDVPAQYDILQTSLGAFDTLGYRFNLANLPEGNVFRNTMSLNGSLSI